MFFKRVSFIHLLQNGPIKLGDKQFACPYCSKIMKTNTLMERHILIHTGHKPFPCTYCPKGFVQRSDLDRHITTHTGEKPYACDQCIYRTASLSSLGKTLFFS